MMKQSESLNSWEQDMPEKVRQFQPMEPRKLLKIVDLLKQQNIFTIKAKFAFPTKFQKQKFLDLLKNEEDDEYFRENSYNKKEQRRKSVNNQRSKAGKGCTFNTGSYLKSEIFLNAYRGNKLDQLQKKYSVKIFPLGPDLYIQGIQSGGNNIRQGSIVYSQVMDMAKRLKQYIFFNEPDLWETVRNSEEFKRRLQKIGIRSYVREGRSKHVAFYSQNHQPQQIRKEVMKQNLFQSRVLKLQDAQLSSEANTRIFDVLVKSIKSTIDQLRDIYETNLQINKSNSSFILHIKHEAFAEEPISEISEVVSHLFIMSFPLRQSRSFINQLRRNPNLYHFIHATHNKKTAFCCINRKRIKNKKDILAVFGQFLDQLNENSKLTIHLKANSVLQQNSTMPQKILDLTQECKLEVDDYTSIRDKQKFNIVVKPRLFNSESKKTQKQLEFSNFFLKLLMLEQNQRQITEDELNQSLLNNSMIAQQKTNDSKNNQKSKRGNRNRAEQKVQNEKSLNICNQVNKSEIKQEGKNQRRGRGNRQYNKQQNSQSVELMNNSQNQWSKSIDQQSMASKIQQDIYEGCFLKYNYTKPAQLQGQQLYKKQKLDNALNQNLQSKQGLTVKSWKLKINYSKFNVNQQSDVKIDKERCYLVSAIEENNKPIQKLNHKKFNQLQSEQYGFIVYQSQDQSTWIPTHMIQKQ